MPSLIQDRAASTPEMLAAFGDEALVAAALRFERELAQAQASVGLISQDAAAAVTAACAQEIDIPGLAEAAAHAGTLAIPLVKLLREQAPEAHKGATSQDVADTALMLMSKAGVELLTRDGRKLVDLLAALAERHADTPMLGRTLLQGALPITFGLKVTTWLSGVAEALARVEAEAASLRLQFGGATGSLAGLDGKGGVVAERLAAALGLAVSQPWHADRQSIAGLGAALAILTGALSKIARDVSLMAQGEVGEAFEPQVEGRGGSSAMAHKRNPTGCQIALSAAMRAAPLAGGLIAGLAQEHERGLGGWQAEGPVVADLFQLTHGALAAMLTVVAGLDVRAERMAENLDAAGVGADTGEAGRLTWAAIETYRGR